MKDQTSLSKEPDIIGCPVDNFCKIQQLFKILQFSKVGI